MDRPKTDPATEIEPPCEQRAAARVALMLRAAKLRLDSGEFLCVVRDASATGVKVRLFHDLPKHRTGELELGTGDRYPLELVWAEHGHAGYRFIAGAINLGDLIDESTPHPRRDLRLQLDYPVTLTSTLGCHPATLRDISRNGALIDHASRLPLGLQLSISGAGLPPLLACVRWRLQRAHGLVFQRSFRLDELAEVVAALRSECAA